MNQSIKLIQKLKQYIALNKPIMCHMFALSRNLDPTYETLFLEFNCKIKLKDQQLSNFRTIF